METLLHKINQCNHCKTHLPLGPRPVVQLHPLSKIVIIGQAPGKRVHESGIPWNDASGKKLRTWLQVDEATFYDPIQFSIMPMSFCFPGKGKSGDLPPRKECAPLWHNEIFGYFKHDPLILLIGHYAQQYYLKQPLLSLTECVKNYKKFLPHYFPLPHPSPRNQNWLKVNPWFEEEVLGELREVVSRHLTLV